MTEQERMEKIEWINLIERYGKESLKQKSDKEIEKLYNLAMLRQTDEIFA
ncbi:BH0509 family protein [Bacillus paralicheniformis]|uniref:BH0509 family protein n=1 Tax=Bacillus paralicheniformis TaxID=1648923 RepID=A0AAW6KDZ3_9BACI|nr:BH0509 family protein [Bacillus paralicheniformis]MBC8621373.1 BH0509 family protein [Robertmurraya crescens]MBL7478241.1 BH0509 family protein [Bacillus paralicheniformis]MCM3424067.1 BH0509 family protein [Bacillus paralicheniformis]MDE1385605.1 BH0509 family protein [Bacillus paralicheniformis]MDE1453727.1 BH0509 family protein [Bacillus paralicheniformis]